MNAEQVEKQFDQMIDGIYSRGYIEGKADNASSEWVVKFIDIARENRNEYAKQEKIKLLERCKIYLKHPDKNIEGYSYFRIEEELEQLNKQA